MDLINSVDYFAGQIYSYLASIQCSSFGLAVYSSAKWQSVLPMDEIEINFPGEGP